MKVLPVISLMVWIKSVSSTSLKTSVTCEGRFRAAAVGVAGGAAAADRLSARNRPRMQRTVRLIDTNLNPPMDVAVFPRLLKIIFKGHRVAVALECDHDMPRLA